MVSLNKDKVLIIDDEKELAEILRDYLEVEGYDVSVAYDGEEGLAEFISANPKIVLLDIMLPKIDGISLCKKIREKSDIPIIMLSAKSGDMDKVVALGIGADDYVTKPFSPVELVARVKANLRRYSNLNDSKIKKIEVHEIKIGELKLNKDSYMAYVGEETLNFTTKEFEILYFLMENEDRIFTKEQIYESIWGFNKYGDITSVTVYIK